MTTTASASQNTSGFPFEFVPQATQDTDLLRELSFFPGLKEILTLRQVHALEHATVWVLSEAEGTAKRNADNQLGGMSTEQGFYIYGEVKATDLRRAAHLALERITCGEWDLAVHPRCGTNLSVGMMLTVGLAMGASMMLPRSPVGQFLGLGLAATAASAIAPDLGMVAQRYLTTAIPFNLAIASIEETRDIWGQTAHFVGVRWRD